ncbi:MAG: tetratricopeptide repeat protein, partial [Spartobacteria bacterium]|nr:tetratricopeptide repeat protein [Spartobacteria bacterium]
LGERYTLFAAAFLNLVVFALAWTWSKGDLSLIAEDTSFCADDRVEETGETTEAPGNMAVILVALAMAGFASMGFEIVWSRVVALILGSSVYAFSAMLGVFLIGVAIGAAWAGAALKRYGARIGWFIAAEIGIALWMILTIPQYEKLATFIGVFNTAVQGHFSWILMAIFLGCFFMVLVPALLMGTTIPFVMALVNKGQHVGRYTGIVYASNTIGGILGSLLTGFLIAPRIGIQNTFLLCVTLNLLAAGCALMYNRRAALLPKFAIVAVLVFLGITTWSIAPWDPIRIATGAFLYGPNEDFPAELVFYKDGVSCTVTVEEYPDGSRTLRVNGKADASTDIDMSNQIMTGLLPMLFKPDAKRVLVIGYGSGVSVASVCHYDVEQIECAELERRVMEADPYFNMVNHSPLEDPRLTIIVEDGRNIIETAREPYDVIISEPSNPWMAGIADLFTQDYYKKCHRGLTKDGVMCQWLQAYKTSLDDFKTIMKTFSSVFPYHAIYKVSSGDFLLLGSEQELIPDLADMQKKINTTPLLARDLSVFCGTSDIRALLTRYFVFDATAYDTFAQDAPRILRDAHNTLGYTAARNLFTSDEERGDMIRDALYLQKNQILPKGTQLVFTGQDHDLSAALLNVGNFCLDAGNLATAETAYQWSMKADPRNLWATSGLLKTALLGVQDESAIGALVTAVADGDPTTAHETCRWLFEHNQIDVATAILRRLAERFPDSITIKARLASALANQGKIEEAMATLQAAHAMDPLNEAVNNSMMLINSMYSQTRAD